MRAEQAMMIGVGLLGAFAVYKMVSSKQAEEKPGPSPGLLPGLPGTPDRPTGTGLIMLGDPLRLKQGQYYRARMLLVGRTAFPFTNTATEEVLGKSLAAMGFADIRVFMELQDLPRDWPASTTVGAIAGTRWFQGMWKGPSIELPRPLTIEAMWPTEPPQAAVSGLGYRYGTRTG